MRNDDQLLEIMTEVFTKLLIQNKFNDHSYYMKLSKRLAELINAEIEWRTKYEQSTKAASMAVWGPLVN